jgi:solute carrier family 10 (sodium/bile acid cotransporter), member 7
VVPFLRHYWFLLALTALFALGFFAWRPLAPLADQAWLRNITIALAMLLMALPLEASVIGNALRRPWATLLAVAVSFGVVPLIAWGFSPLLTPPLAGGLLVAAVTPCTMASATVWTRKAGGNDAAATVVTVATNLVCFLVTPVWLFVLTGQQTQQSLREMGDMVLKLLLVVVLPVAGAQLLRLRDPIALLADRRRIPLAAASQCCILLMVLIGAVNTGESIHKELHPTAAAVDDTPADDAPVNIGSPSTQPTTPARLAVNLTTMVFVVMLVHILAFWIGLALARVLRLSWPDQLAVAFSGSQKTLMVGMGVSLSAGFSVLPMVTYHVSQLFIDTLLAQWLSGKPK